jgi:hypothetical protein
MSFKAMRTLVGQVAKQALSHFLFRQTCGRAEKKNQLSIGKKSTFLPDRQRGIHD